MSHENCVAPSHLTFRQVLALSIQKMRNKDITEELPFGVKTVEDHRGGLMKSFGCPIPAELVPHAIRRVW